MADKKFSEFTAALGWSAAWEIVGYDPGEANKDLANKRVPYSALTGTFALKSELTAHTGDTDIHVVAAQAAALDASTSPSGVNPYLTQSAGDTRYLTESAGDVRYATAAQGAKADAALPKDGSEAMTGDLTFSQAGPIIHFSGTRLIRAADATENITLHSNAPTGGIISRVNGSDKLEVTDAVVTVNVPLTVPDGATGIQALNRQTADASYAAQVHTHTGDQVTITAGTQGNAVSIAADGSLQDSGTTPGGGGSAPNIDENDIAARRVGDPTPYAGVGVADLTEEATPAAGHMLLGWVAGALRKLDVGNLPSGGGGDLTGVKKQIVVLRSGAASTQQNIPLTQWTPLNHALLEDTQLTDGNLSTSGDVRWTAPRSMTISVRAQILIRPFTDRVGYITATSAIYLDAARIGQYNLMQVRDQATQADGNMNWSLAPMCALANVTAGQIVTVQVYVDGAGSGSCSSGISTQQIEIEEIL